MPGFGALVSVGALGADVAEPSADPGRGEPSGLGGAFPGAAQVVGEGAGEAKLGVDGDDQPGPSAGGLRAAYLRCDPAQDLLEQAEGVFKVESSQERLPEPVDVGGRGAGARPPEPDRLGVASAGQVVDLQPDHRALDDGQLTLVLQPGGVCPASPSRRAAWPRTTSAATRGASRWARPRSRQPSPGNTAWTSRRGTRPGEAGDRSPSFALSGARFH